MLIEILKQRVGHFPHLSTPSSPLVCMKHQGTEQWSWSECTTAVQDIFAYQKNHTKWCTTSIWRTSHQTHGCGRANFSQPRSQASTETFRLSVVVRWYYGAGTSDSRRPSGAAGGCRATKGLRGTAVRTVLWEYPARDRGELVLRLR